jgi:hypothetical protein
MGQLRFANVSSILVGATVALACSSADDRTPAVADSSSPVDTNTPADPEGPAAEAPTTDAPPSEEPSVAGSSEGQPTPVGLTPSMEDETPPVGEMPPAEEPVPPEMEDPVDDGAPVPSAGCSSTAAPVQSGRFTIDVGGTAREYILELPESYDLGRRGLFH